MDESVTRWMNELAQSDDRATQRLWQRYHQQPVRLARRRLGRAGRQGAEEEDVMRSAFNSFCQGIAAGGFPRLSDRHDLGRRSTRCRSLRPRCLAPSGRHWPLAY
jgi:hypothetical protein